ncbi:hypothetical protein [Corallococcus carmarthensis]|uniref:hypothetical protein n=1 Tax=Corallococcus carmarthensis TaxID=2316728 RepID=UPI001ABF1F69|nr:hypothetical protein [Corallococcus carmarthensis]
MRAMWVMEFLEGGTLRTAPWAIANASFKQQQGNKGVPEIQELPNRGHSLIIDSGWREGAAVALEFVKRFV